MRHTALMVTCGVFLSSCTLINSFSIGDAGRPESDGAAADAGPPEPDGAAPDAGRDAQVAPDAGDGGSAECSGAMTRPCPDGIETGECIAGTQPCVDGSWGSCEGVVGPAAELCDGLDNDCDSTTDGPTAAATCGSATRASAVGCSAGTCVITTCADGYADCDREFETGCEAAIGTVDACTACGDSCDWSCGGAGGCNDAVQVVSGLSHHCALLETGRVVCWGQNTYGQLGDGSTLTRLSPAEVTGLGDVVELAAGTAFTCARTGGGTVHCWGRNELGELGDGTTTNRPSPALVSGLSAVSAIGAGNTHACAVVPGGFVRCWGDNFSGQLGDGSTTRRLTPVSVSGLGGVSLDVTGGSSHTCALMNDGAVRCWGNNGDGQIGDGTTSNRPSPTTVPSVAAVTVLSSRQGHTCAVTSAGALLCWGRNYDGQIGDGSALSSVRSPATVDLGGSVASVSAGNDHTCAVRADGAAFCWGAGGDRIGDGSSSTADRRTPVAVEDISGIVEVSAGGSSCGRNAGGALWCWGGGTGDGTSTPSNRPVPVSPPR